MANFHCRACGEEGSFVYDGRRDCPNCGSGDVQLALSIEELSDGDPIIEAMTRLADDHED